jgi:hypothetical protein
MVLLVLAKIGLATLPFRVIEKTMGRRRALENKPEEASVPTTITQRCRWAVSAGARHLPLDLPCLPQAIVGQLMLRRRGFPASVVFGLARGEADWYNHAWLEAGGQPVLGYQPAKGYGVSRPGVTWRPQTLS